MATIGELLGAAAREARTSTEQIATAPMLLLQALVNYLEREEERRLRREEHGLRMRLGEEELKRGRLEESRHELMKLEIEKLRRSLEPLLRQTEAEAKRSEIETRITEATAPERMEAAKGAAARARVETKTEPYETRRIMAEANKAELGLKMTRSSLAESARRELEDKWTRILGEARADPDAAEELVGDFLLQVNGLHAPSDLPELEPDFARIRNEYQTRVEARFPEAFRRVAAKAWAAISEAGLPTTEPELVEQLIKERGATIPLLRTLIDPRSGNVRSPMEVKISQADVAREIYRAAPDDQAAARALSQALLLQPEDWWRKVESDFLSKMARIYESPTVTSRWGHIYRSGLDLDVYGEPPGNMPRPTITNRWGYTYPRGLDFDVYSMPPGNMPRLRTAARPERLTVPAGAGGEQGKVEERHPTMEERVWAARGIRYGIENPNVRELSTIETTAGTVLDLPTILGQWGAILEAGGTEDDLVELLRAQVQGRTNFFEILSRKMEEREKKKPAR